MNRNAQTGPISPIFWILTGFLTIVFLTGGASRIDVQSRVVFLPMSAIMCAMALVTLKREHLRRQKGLFALFGAIVLVILLNLVPLPPAIWQLLPGREPFTAIDKLAQLGNVWRPWTLTPLNAWHSLASLLTPLAVLLFGVQLKRPDLYRLLYTLLALCGLSAILAILQLTGGTPSPFFLYSVTHDGSAVGLFANRNHAAVLLAMMFSMLVMAAVYERGGVRRHVASNAGLLSIAILLLPLILVSGSRSGLVAGVISVIATALLHKAKLKKVLAQPGGRSLKGKSKQLLLGAGTIGVGLVLLTAYLSRAEAIERWLITTPENEGRTNIWLTTLSLIPKYFPVGSGVGSFVEVYQVDEPTWLLDPTFTNHAHNDWLEIVLTLGVVGLLFLLIGVAAYAKVMLAALRSPDPERSNVKFARLGGLMLFILSIASISDYPLRTPIMMSVAAIASLWLCSLSRTSTNNRAQSNQDRADG